MSEKATLVNKIPPVGKQEIKVSFNNQPADSKSVANTSANQASSRSADEMAMAHSQVAPPEVEITVTPLESTTYYSFLGNTLLLGAISIVFASKAFKNTKSVNFKVSAGFALFAFVLAGFYFYMKGTFSGFLWGDMEPLPFTARGFAWMFFGPSLFIILSFLDSIKIQEKSTLGIPIALAAAIFLFIGLAQLPGFTQGLKLAFSALAIICSGALTLGIFTFLAKLPDDMDDNFIKGFQMVVLVIACGWLGYPLLNMVSLFVDSATLFHLLLNLLDLGTVAAMAYGFHVCMTFKIEHAAVLSGKKMKKPKMRPNAGDKEKSVARSLMD